MAAVGEPMREHALHRPQHVVDATRQHDARQRQVAAGDTLREDHQVGLDVPVLQAEPPPGTPESGDHLVGYQQQAVLVADLAEQRKVVNRRHDHTAGALHRLRHDGGHGLRTRFQHDLLQGLHVSHSGGALAGIAVRVGRGSVQESRREWFETLPEVGQARGARGSVRKAVIVASPRDDVHTIRFRAQLPVEPGDLVSGVVRFGASGGEIGHLEIARRQLRQPGRKPDGRRRPKAAVGGAESQSGHLLRGRCGKHFAAVTHIDIPERGHAVDVLASFDVGQPRALSADHDQLRDRSGSRRKIALRMKPVCPVELGKPARLLG